MFVRDEMKLELAQGFYFRFPLVLLFPGMCTSDRRRNLDACTLEDGNNNNNNDV